MLDEALAAMVAYLRLLHEKATPEAILQAFNEYQLLARCVKAHFMENRMTALSRRWCARKFSGTRTLAARRRPVMIAQR